jgi:hypothetical protein
MLMAITKREKVKIKSELLQKKKYLQRSPEMKQKE